MQSYIKPNRLEYLRRSCERITRMVSEEGQVTVPLILLKRESSILLRRAFKVWWLLRFRVKRH
jgi:hypothetical protein